MSKNEIATLDASLNKEAEIYKELKKQPDWWQRLLSVKGVYVEIRKDDIVDVYYEGGRMAELRCKCKRITLPYKSKEPSLVELSLIERRVPNG